MPEASSRPPLVTVVMPVFNGERWLEESIQSVLASSYTNWEMICVDDGSLDNSGKILSEFAKVNPKKVSVIASQNFGEPNAVNLGFRSARGKYLLVLSCDDRIHPDLLERSVSVLEDNHSLDVVYPDWEIIDSDGKVVSQVRVPEYSLERLVARVECLPGPGALIRRGAIRRYVLRDRTHPLISDYEQWLFLAEAHNFVRLPSFLAQWRQHPDGQTASITSERRDEALARLLESLPSFRADLPRVRRLSLLGLLTLRVRSSVEPGSSPLLSRGFWRVIQWAIQNEPEIVISYLIGEGRLALGRQIKRFKGRISRWLRRPFLWVGKILASR